MVLNTYYVSWHTWREDQVDTPWDIWFLSKGEKTKVLAHTVDLDQIQKIWQNQDVQAWQSLQQSHVWDIKLAAFIQAEDTEKAQSQVMELFPDADWDKCVQVDDVTKQQIIQLFSDTLNKAA